MAKTKAPTMAPEKQPTFAECSVEGWWDEDSGGAWVPAISGIHGDLWEDMTQFMEQVRNWWRIQDDPDEAAARTDYASHAARYLAGIFPNARVNVEAFAAAAGEDLGRFSADIVKMVAEKARRTSKTLPSLAQLLEWAKAEAERRSVQYDVFLTAMRDFDAAIERGRAQAREVIEKGGLTGRLTVELLETFHRGLTLHSIGIQPPPPIVYGCGRSVPCYVTKMTALYRMVMNGHEGAAEWLVNAATESGGLAALAREASASDPKGDHWRAWHDHAANCRAPLIDLLDAQMSPSPAGRGRQ